MDLRKTKILPLFVPDPENTEIDNTAIFKITGGCYFWQFSLFDGDPNGTVYKNYTSTRFTLISPTINLLVLNMRMVSIQLS